MKSVSSSVVARAVVLAVLAIGAAGLSSSADAWGGRKNDPREYAKRMELAEAAVSGNRIEAALIAFDEAAQADTTRKEPWVRSAQLRFDAGHNGHAIAAAEEVLKRDPADKVADSVLTLAGLRVASQSLQRLQASGALGVSDTARSEAEKLAATMRQTLGEDILLERKPKAKGKAKPKPKSKSNAAPRAAAIRASATAETPPRRAAAKPEAGKAESKPASANPFL